MLQSKTIRGFAIRFILLCGLLIGPWPGWNQIYGDYFRGMGELAFSKSDQQRFVTFAPYSETHDFSALDTQVTLGNKKLIDSSGHGPAKQLSLNSRSIGWLPTALTISLILATPLPWRRRVGALIIGLILIHCFILFSLQTWIWDESTDLSLLALTPAWQSIVDNLEYTLIIQIGTSFSVPVLIWALVCQRFSH